MILIGAVAESFVLFGIIREQGAIGGDLGFYQAVAHRWLDSGVYYTGRQLDGPYQVQTQVDNLYPPHALFLFVPFLILPAILWWIVPLALVAYVVSWCRPVAWSLPILALLVLFPKTPNLIIYGNADMWVAAAIAAGVRWGWAAVLVTFKPSVAFFAVIGIRTRRWWIAAGVLVVASLPLLGLWLEYPRALLNSSVNAWYSIGDLPYMALPIVAWLASTRRGRTPGLRWAVALLTRGQRLVGE